MTRLALAVIIVLCSYGAVKVAGLEMESQRASRIKQMERTVVEAQAQCSTQAAAKALALGYSPVSATSHYNAFLSKCFLRIDNTNSTAALTTTAISLLDVSTNREIGEFFRTVARGDSIEEAPALCNLVISEQDESCTSPEQFTALARHYME